MAKHRTRLHHLLSLSGTDCTSLIEQTTPLKRLQGRMARVIKYVWSFEVPKLANTGRPPIVRAALGYTSQYQRDIELDSSQPRYSTSNSVPVDLRMAASSSRCGVSFKSLGDQRNALSVSESYPPNIEMPCPTTTIKQSGLKKSSCIDLNGHEGQHGSRRARKPRCGIDRLDDYNAGGSVDDAATPLLEGTELRRTFELQATTFG